MVHSAELDAIDIHIPDLPEDPKIQETSENSRPMTEINRYFAGLNHFLLRNRYIFPVIAAILVVALNVTLEAVGLFFDLWLTGLLTAPFLLVPCIWMFLGCFSTPLQRRSSPTERIAQAFVYGFVLDSLLFWIQSVIILLLVNFLVFLSESVPELVFWVALIPGIVFFSFVVYAIPEESLKYIIVKKLKGQHSETPYSAVAFAIGTTAGLVTFCLSMTIARAYWGNGSFYLGLEVLALESVFSTTVHMICGFWIGMSHSRSFFRDPSKPERPFWKILWRPVLFHGSYSSFVMIILLADAVGKISYLLMVITIAFATLLLVALLVYTVFALHQQVHKPELYSPLANLNFKPESALQRSDAEGSVADEENVL